MSEGRVIRTYNSFYYVASGSQVFTCKIKGRLKQQHFSLCCGDWVEFLLETETEGMITKILPRRNFMTRPAVANLDRLLLTMAVVQPEFSTLILDKLLVLAASEKMPAAVVLNKIDLAPAGRVHELAARYGQAGYAVFAVSAKTGEGVDALRRFLAGKITALGGPSGVGKSSLLNILLPGSAQRTGQLSEKISRGRHTTRFTTLIPFAGGYLADTPGFGNVFMDKVQLPELAGYFADFTPFIGGCKFRPCSHIHEKVCGVKAAVAQGKLAASRYESYVAIRQELEAAQERIYH